MSFITLANTKKIIFNSNTKSLDLKGDIYKIPIYFFNKYEENALLAIQELLKDPEKYFSEIYKPYKPIDTYSYVYEGKKPSYHKYRCCPRLQSDYQNFEVPQEIKDKGTDAVQEFRQWFETVKHLLDKPDIFVERLRIKYGIVTNPKAINLENSGLTKRENLTIDELEERIDSLIKEAGLFYYKNKKNTTILNRFSKYTYIASKPDEIYTNDTSYSDVEVKKLLKDYDREFKIPLKRLLIEYYRLKQNPEIKMEGHFLEQLGFLLCKYCHNSEYFPENIDVALKSKNKVDWDIINRNIEFFRTLYSIHYSFSLKEFQSTYENIKFGGTFNSCFEVEEGWVRDCRNPWGFYYNQKIIWNKTLRKFREEKIYFFEVKEDQFPLSIENELEFYFHYNENSYNAYGYASNEFDLDYECFLDSEGYLDSVRYDSMRKTLELKANRDLSYAQLLDAKFRLDFYNFNQSDYDLEYFLETFRSGNDFEIIKFIFNESLFSRVCNIINEKVPNFKIEKLFNQIIKSTQI
jgi:hypothetical protein